MYNFLSNKEEEVYTGLLEFIRDFVKDKSVTLGLSGGIDSSVSTFLATKALGREKVTVVILENTNFTKEGIVLAKKFAEHLGVNVKTVQIENIRDDLVESLGLHFDYKQLATIDVRLCDIVIRTVTQHQNSLYLGTINGTERSVGWFPKGALIGDFCPIGGLMKHQLKELATYLEINSFAEGISQDASIVCGGCGEHEDFKGLPYEELDKILIAFQLGTLEKEFEKDYLFYKYIPIVIDRVKSAEHKRGLFPPYFDVTNILT